MSDTKSYFYRNARHFLKIVIFNLYNIICLYFSISLFLVWCYLYFWIYMSNMILGQDSWFHSIELGGGDKIWPAHWFVGITLFFASWVPLSHYHSITGKIHYIAFITMYTTLSCIHYIASITNSTLHSLYCNYYISRLHLMHCIYHIAFNALVFCIAFLTLYLSHCISHCIYHIYCMYLLYCTYPVAL